MKPVYSKIVALTVSLAATSYLGAAAAETPPSLVTPDKVETSIGTLEFKDGLPSKATLDKVHDSLDYTHGLRAFSDTLQGVSIHALRKGLQDIGVKDNEVIVFSKLMDAKSLFLTANADTIYVIGGLEGTDRTLATALQHNQTAQFARLQTASTRHDLAARRSFAIS